MKKILSIMMGVLTWFHAASVFAAPDKFDILPDLPEPLAAAQASSVSTVSDATNSVGVATQSVGAEPNILSVVFSLIFVILLIYATGIIYAKLNKIGLKGLRRELRDCDNSRVSVLSTTPLGNNKSLHVVELDGKRMLIGASTGSIQLLKDLGTYTQEDLEEGEYSEIEIPHIRIPKIEIPKIEFPGIKFKKSNKPPFYKDSETGDKNSETAEFDVDTATVVNEENSDEFEISDIYEEGPDGIIDKLFTKSDENNAQEVNEADDSDIEHKVDPEEFALYKKYL